MKFFDCHRWRSLLRAAATVALIAPAAGAVNAQSVCDSAEVWFRQSHSELDTTFGDNGAQLRRMTAGLDTLMATDGYRLRSVRVVGAASPEGSARFNSELSKLRAGSICDYFANRGLRPDSLSVDYRGRDWSGLLQLVNDDESVPARAEVMKIVEGVIASGSNEAEVGNRALARLKRLGGGSAYGYIYTRLFPKLRSSRLFVEYEPAGNRQPLYVDVITSPEPDSLPEPDAMIEQEIAEGVTFTPEENHRKLYMGLKTNMLYDALALPNIGAEFYIGRGWSVGANWMYGWWDRDNRHRYWRAYGGDVNVRRWLGSAAADMPLAGHHIGLYAGVVTYDFEFGHTGYMGGNPGGNIFDRCNYFGGIEYGYSLPVGRRLNIDFTIGIGYLGGKYQKYVPCESGGYLWQSTHRVGWFGPTKAEISLVWLIGSDNFNGRK
ncbi:MAG: DUF3575 domain-containing protein [Bacteroides sp.]|nr:DUF3575 domain-containing protein [Bacteroides sp.]